MPYILQQFPVVVDCLVYTLSRADVVSAYVKHKNLKIYFIK